MAANKLSDGYEKYKNKKKEKKKKEEGKPDKGDGKEEDNKDDNETNLQQRTSCLNKDFKAHYKGEKSESP